MKQFINHERINRKAMLSNIGSIGGLILLLISVLMPLFFPKTASISAIFIIVGICVSMVGIFYANRWVRKPRPEDRLGSVLKGLGDKFMLFHYPNLPVEHILLSPAGVIVFETFNLGGVFSYRDGKWKERMTIGRALRYIVEEHLGDPTRAAVDSASYIRQELSKIDGLSMNIPVKAQVVFIHPATRLDINNPPVPVCNAEKLRKQLDVGNSKLPQEDYVKVMDFLISVTS